MRIPMLAVLCSAFTGCFAPIGPEHDNGDRPDAGSTSDGGAVNGCETKTGDVLIDAMSDFDTLPKGCWNAGARLTIKGSAVTSLERLGDLKKVQSIELDGTPLQAFNSKAPIDVTGDIVIANNAQLTSLDNLKPLDTVASVRVEGNQLLANLGGLAGAKKISSATIRNNPQLTTLELRADTISGDFIVEGNAKLVAPTLDNVTTIGNYMVRDNVLLTSIGALPKLTTISGNLVIDNNDRLATLSPTIGGTALRISGFIDVRNNQVLTSLGNLSHAQQVTGTVQFSYNPALHYHVVYEYACCVQSGATYIDNSGPSCANNNTPYCGNNCPSLN